MFTIKYFLKTFSQTISIGILVLFGINGLRQPGFAQSQARIIETYFNAGYGYCDAQMLGRFWETTPETAKLRAAKGLMGWDGFSRNIPDKLLSARRLYSGQGVCNYSSDFSYEDAVALASYWNIPIGNAKDTLTGKLESGNLQLAKDVVQMAHRSSPNSNSSRSRGVTGFNVEVVYHSQGSFINRGDGYWNERDANGNTTFNFREVNRTEYSVYLNDRSRNIAIQLDLPNRKIFYTEENRSTIGLYDITSAQSNRLRD